MDATQPARHAHTEQATKPHRCSSRCHRCPDLVEIVRKRGGDVNDEIETTMPGCWGMTMGYFCNCPPRRTTLAQAEAHVAKLKAQRVDLDYQIEVAEGHADRLRPRPSVVR